ncbi:hypothetical protein G7Y79_00013g033920 [Physcia stellaris]|nr:hypothetical protein G7Y79_00013g033920 [Physcia stellaris]
MSHAKALSQARDYNSWQEVSDSSPLLRSDSSTHNSGNSQSSVSSANSSAHSLPPADHGRAAWLFLAGCFLIEGLIWGLPFSYGVFQEYYSESEPFSQYPQGIASVGTTTTGLLYFLSPVAVIALQRWPSRRLSITLGSLALVTLSLVVASFSTQVSHLILTQGALYGIGGAFLYNPFVFYLDEWFIERKGLAFGILWAGTGISGTIVPVLMGWGLGKYGFRTMLRAWGNGHLPRHYALDIPDETAAADTGQGNTYASSIGLSSLSATFAVSILNCASVIGTIIIGSLTDYLHITTVIVISATVSALSALLLWGFASAKPMLYVFAFAYGIFAGGYTATWTGCVAEIQRDSRDAETGVVLGMMAATRGIGAVVSGPLSEQLLKNRPAKGQLSGGYGSEYGVLILFTGVTAILGGLGVVERIRLWGVDDSYVESIREICRTHEDMR